MAVQLTIKKQDITKLDVDCIVNAANSQLRHGGGVCGVIFAAAGAKELQDACNQYGFTINEYRADEMLFHHDLQIHLEKLIGNIIKDSLN